MKAWRYWICQNRDIDIQLRLLSRLSKHANQNFPFPSRDSKSHHQWWSIQYLLPLASLTFPMPFRKIGTSIIRHFCPSPSEIRFSESAASVFAAVLHATPPEPPRATPPPRRLLPLPPSAARCDQVRLLKDLMNTKKIKIGRWSVNDLQTTTTT